MAEPHELTTEEVRERFLQHVRGMVDWWATDSRTPDPSRKLSGLAFSILAALDGCAAELPGFVVTPNPHPNDADFAKSEGEDWYPSGEEHDIAGSLHELFYVEGWKPGGRDRNIDPEKLQKAIDDAAERGGGMVNADELLEDES